MTLFTVGSTNKERARLAPVDVFELSPNVFENLPTKTFSRVLFTKSTVLLQSLTKPTSQTTIYSSNSFNLQPSKIGLFVNRRT